MNHAGRNFFHVMRRHGQTYPRSAAKLSRPAGVGLLPAVEIEQRIAKLIGLYVSDRAPQRAHKAPGIDAVTVITSAASSRHAVQQGRAEGLAALIDTKQLLLSRGAVPARHQ